MSVVLESIPQFNLRVNSHAEGIRQYEEAFDGLLDNDNPLKAKFRKTLLKYFNAALMAGFNANSKKQLNIKTDIVGIDEMRASPPSTKACLSTVNTALNTKKEVEKNGVLDEQTNEIILNQVTSCIAAGQKLSKENKKNIEEHLKLLFKDNDFDYFCREVVIAICAHFFKHNTFQGVKEAVVIPLAKAIAHLSYIIILGTNTKHKVNLKTKIIDEIGSSGYIRDHADVFQMHDIAIPGNHDTKIRTENGHGSKSKPFTYYYEQTVRQSGSPISSTASSAASSRTASSNGSQHSTECPEQQGMEQTMNQKKWYKCFSCCQ